LTEESKLSGNKSFHSDKKGLKWKRKTSSAERDQIEAATAEIKVKKVMT